MARIPDDVIERLKATVPCNVWRRRGVVLTKHGADLHGRCPSHEDRTPSLVITPAKNLWHCLGACQTEGPTRVGTCSIRASSMLIAF
jgi:DNA primase